MEDINKYFTEDFNGPQNQAFVHKDEMSLKMNFHLDSDFISDLNREDEHTGNSNEFFLNRLDEQSSSRNNFEERPHKCSFFANRSKIFRITRDHEAEEMEDESEDWEQLKSNSKVISKREKGKAKVSQNFPEIDTAQINKQIEEEMKAYQHLDERSKKKMVQMLRNRISAQTSRDRKKFYLSNLEQENMELRQENDKLKERVKELEDRQHLWKDYTCKQCKHSENTNTTYNFLETGTRENEFEIRTNTAHTSSKLFSLFGLLCIVALIALVSNNVDRNGFADRNSVIRLLENRDLDIDASEYTFNTTATKADVSQTHCGTNYHSLLKKIKDIQRVMENRKHGQNWNRGNITNSRESKRKFLEKEETNYLVPIQVPDRSESLFCPSGILIEPVSDGANYTKENTHLTTEKLVNRFQNSSYLQLFIPTKNLSGITGMRPETWGSIDKEPGDVLEMICSLKTVREVSLSKQ